MLLPYLRKSNLSQNLITYYAIMLHPNILSHLSKMEAVQKEFLSKKLLEVIEFSARLWTFNRKRIMKSERKGQN